MKIFLCFLNPVDEVGDLVFSRWYNNKQNTFVSQWLTSSDPLISLSLPPIIDLPRSYSTPVQTFFLFLSLHLKHSPLSTLPTLLSLFASPSPKMLVTLLLKLHWQLSHVEKHQTKINQTFKLQQKWAECFSWTFIQHLSRIWRKHNALMKESQAQKTCDEVTKLDYRWWFRYFCLCDSKRRVPFRA